MIKKILKFSIKSLAAITLLIVLIYGGFHLWEYATGGKYIKYLSENSETIPLDATFTFDELGKDIEKNQLVMVGEIHGCHEPNQFDIDLFKYVNENHKVNHYIAELDFVQASLLNDFLKTGDEKTLEVTLKNWVVMQGRKNKDYFDKYRELHRYHQQVPDSRKFEIIGIDRLQDGALLKEYLTKLYPATQSDDVLKDKSNSDLIEELQAVYSENPDTLFILSHLKSNIKYSKEKVGRDEVMFQNFSKIYKEDQLEENRLYGFMGLGHVFQYRVNGKHPFVSKVRISDLGLAGKILSINIMMNDSYMVMPSRQLPEFMRDEGPYTKMAISADNMLFVYIVGIKDFKRMTPEFHKSLIKMNKEDNPYANTSRLNKTIQLLPVTDVLELTDKGEAYFQYTLFVRNSDWAEPML